MIEIEVSANIPYKVVVGNGILDNIGNYLKENIKTGKAALITDTNVAKLYSDRVCKSLVNSGIEVVSKAIPSGEQYKNFATFKDISEFLADNRLTRNDTVLSLGGGVVSDVAGFAASCYLRGIRHIILPTTLLNIIDASIGGKTAIDIENGKNLVGAFHQPSLVYSDLDTLKTLDKDNLICGIGEGIKYALLQGGECFEIIKNGLSEENFNRFVVSCIKYKIDIVQKDEREGNIRKLLNFGHTYGHAFEQASGYSIPHGAAVVLGILEIVKKFPENLTETDISDILKIAVKYGFDRYKVPVGNISSYIQMDKKRDTKSTIDLVLLNKIGKPIIKNMPTEEL